MDPRRLLTFRTVAHERSFSRAATKLSLSQPSVSHQVALLETEIRLRLLDRGRGGLRLTRAGEVLLEHADNVAWRLQLADTQIADLAAEGREVVRLGAFPTALAGLVPSAIARLRSTGGERVVLSEVTPSDLEPRFLSGEFDVALGYQDATVERREHGDAERVDLLQETFLIGMSLQHRHAAATGLAQLADFADDDWIMASTEGFLIEACREAGFEPRVVATTTDPLAMRGLISQGFGVGWVPSLLASYYDDAAVRAIDGPVRRRDIYALLPPGDRHPLAAPVMTALTATAGDFRQTRR